MRLVLRHMENAGDKLTDVLKTVRHAKGRVIDMTDNMVLLDASPSAIEEIAQRTVGWQLAPETVVPRPER